MELIFPSEAIFIWGASFLIAFVFWITALISILKNDFAGTNEKLVWIGVVLFIPVLGALLYFFYAQKASGKI